MSDTMRDAFEATLARLSPGCDFSRVNKDNYANRHVHHAWEGWQAAIEWQAAQTQPAPPVPQTVQDIRQIMEPYVRACMMASISNPDGRIDESRLAECDKTYKPLEAALTALVSERDRLITAACRDIPLSTAKHMNLYDIEIARAIERAHGIEPEQRGVDMRSENAARAAAKLVALPNFDVGSSFEETAPQRFAPTTDGYYKISGREGLVQFKNGVEVPGPTQGETVSFVGKPEQGESHAK